MWSASALTTLAGLILGSTNNILSNFNFIPQKMGLTDDDDIPQLPADTLAILQNFLVEKVELAGGKDVNFEEDWQLSQFWYSQKTKFEITKVCQHLITNDDYRIGLLSSPSLYTSIKEVHKNVKLFEYDRRFSTYGDDFIYYDFNEANTPDYLNDYTKYFDLTIVDPPFLSEECIEKVSTIVRKVMKDDSKIIFCSGEVCRPWIEKYLGLNVCEYRPEHERILGNEFVSYSNFELDGIIDKMNKC